MASDTFSCPECNATLRYSPNLQAGASVQCPKCRAEFPVPDAGNPPDAPPSRPTDEVTGAPGPRRPRFSERQDEDYSPSRRPPAYGPGRGDYSDEDHPARPFTGDYSIDLNRWFGFAGENYGAILGATIGFILVALLLSIVPYAIVVGAIGFLSIQMGPDDPSLRLLVTQGLVDLALLVLMPMLFFPLWSGVTAVCLAQLKGRQWAFGDFFSGFQHFSALAGLGLATQILSIVISLPSTALTMIAMQNQDRQMLFVSPFLSLVGIVVMVFVHIRLFLFAPAVIFDRNLGAMEAMKANWELTRGHFWGLFGVSFLLGLINVGGGLACGVGALFSIPYTLLILAAGYLLITDAREPTDYRARYDD